MRVSRGIGSAGALTLCQALRSKRLSMFSMLARADLCIRRHHKKKNGHAIGCVCRYIYMQGLGFRVLCRRNHSAHAFLLNCSGLPARNENVQRASLEP